MLIDEGAVITYVTFGAFQKRLKSLIRDVSIHTQLKTQSSRLFDTLMDNKSKKRTFPTHQSVA